MAVSAKSRAEAGAPETEITPAMIGAGVLALKRRYLDLTPGPELYPEIVGEIFAACMAEASKSSS